MQPTDYPTCSVEGCGRRHSAMGYCAAHAQRVRRTGDPGRATVIERAPRPRRTCAVDGCESPSRLHDLCTMHYQRVRKHGATDVPAKATGPVHHSWRGDDVGYRAVHARLAAQRGAATAYACVDCGDDAEQWSYDNLDVDERCDDQRRVYSLDLDHYAPRCRRCHHAYDCRTSPTHVHDDRLCFHTAVPG